MTNLTMPNNGENVFSAADAMAQSSIAFHSGFDCVIRIDAQGFHYRGQFIEDAGEAHHLLVEFLRKHQPDTDWKHAQ
jgi:hypothetical protein